MKSTTAGTLPLFPSTAEEAKSHEPTAGPAPERAPQGLRAASARLVITRSPDRLDRQQRPLVLLAVDCPFCDYQHIHPAGHPDRPRLCPRRSRCVGRPTGAYYFPEVQQ
ncbi:hypothetical protein V2S66_32905 [Streptomyces sp. V4-01]|uniref:Uncharacterized protein n=1 Tax=Actinacidiphila polyblastidii TaxID=3110430 RepID=A0ABU7PLP7_9ACTN|nr:hypothetical protein [Streptomyces sp. V4-01]